MMRLMVCTVSDVCQQLLPRAQGKGRCLAAEIMIANPAIRALIRDDKAHQIASIIQTSGQLGMKTMNQSIFDAYRTGSVSYEDAMAHSPDPQELQRLLQRAPRTRTRATR